MYVATLSGSKRFPASQASWTGRAQMQQGRTLGFGCKNLQWGAAHLCVEVGVVIALSCVFFLVFFFSNTAR